MARISTIATIIQRATAPYGDAEQEFHHKGPKGFVGEHRETLCRGQSITREENKMK